MMKPRIYKEDGYWHCACRAIIGMGSSIREAFEDWKINRGLMS